MITIKNKKNAAIDVIDKVAFFFFAVLIFFLPIANAIIEITFCLIFVCFLVRMYIKRPALENIMNFFARRVNLALLVFYIGIGLSFFGSKVPARTVFDAWFFKWGEGVLLFYFAQVFLNKKRVAILLGIFLASFFLITLNGLYQKQIGSGFIRGFELVAGSRHDFLAVRSTFNHYNSFAAYLVTAFFIISIFFATFKNYKLRLLFIMLSLLAIINLTLTYSRGGWFAFSSTMLLLAFIMPRGRVKFITAGLLLLLALFFFITPFGIHQIKNFIDRADSSRFRMWHAAFLMFKDSPVVGLGLDSFMKELPHYSKLKGLYAHNSYLQILAETGLVGLVSFLWFLWELVIKGFMKVKKNYDIMGWGLLLALSAFLIHAFFDAHLYSLKLSIMFWFIAGLTVVNKVTADSTVPTTNHD